MRSIPLQLWNQPHWELKGRWDVALFFRHIQAVLPSATSLFVEGSSIAKVVSDFLRSAAEPGSYLPARQSLWPRSQQYRFRFNDFTLATLTELAERHAVPELFDHLFIYEGPNVLVEFPDAFAKDCPAFFSRELMVEERVRDFAALLGLEMTGSTGS